MQVLITVPLEERQLIQINQAFPDVEFTSALSEEEIIKQIGQADIVFGDLSRRSFLAAKNLRWIQSYSAGVNWLMVIPELVAGEVLVTNTRGAHAPTIAEHFFGALISLTRKLPEQYAAQLRKEWLDGSNWPQQVGNYPLGLMGLTLGILGFGNIGRAIAERAVGFQMRIIALDRMDVPRPPYLAELWMLDKLPELLKQSDVLVVTVPGTAETYGMLSRELLALMKPSAYLSVVSRGGIVDEQALVEMLNQGRLAGAFLDVFRTEPLPATSPLWDAPNLILTPHSSGKSENTTNTVTNIFIENLQRYRDGYPLKNMVNKVLGF
jgi:phosphoglycerate dehydrogenase-like enzyme